MASIELVRDGVNISEVITYAQSAAVCPVQFNMLDHKAVNSLEKINSLKDNIRKEILHLWNNPDCKLLRYINQGTLLG